MKKYITLLCILLIIGSCSLYEIEEYNCKNEEISIFNLNKGKLKEICNYEKKVLGYLTRNNNTFDISFFLEASKNDKKLGEYIVKNIDRNKLTLIERIQLYYILKNIFGYKDNIIQDKIGNIKEEYKKFSIGVDRIVSAENLITQVFEGEEDTMEGIKPAMGTLSYGDLMFLKIIFNLEPQRFNSINLVSNLMGGYNILINNKSKVLYVNIMNKLLLVIGDNVSEDVIKRFLKKIKN